MLGSMQGRCSLEQTRTPAMLVHLANLPQALETLTPASSLALESS